MSAVALAPRPIAIPKARLDPGPLRWKWTREDFVRLYELGFFNGQRVMLIDGEVLAMSPMNREHANGIIFTFQILQATFGPSFTIRPQMPLDLGQTTDPEPDIAIVSGSPRSHVNTPTTAELVVEVSDSSLAYDTNDKANLYAAAGIADYWVLDVVNLQLHIFRIPRRDGAQRFGHRYFHHQTLASSDHATPLAAPHSPILVGDMLP